MLINEIELAETCPGNSEMATGTIVRVRSTPGAVRFGGRLSIAVLKPWLARLQYFHTGAG